MATPYTDALKKYGTVRKACAAKKVARSTFFDRLNREKATIAAIQHASRPKVVTLRNRKEVKRYIFTCAVRGGKVHTDFLANLEAYAAAVNAKIVVGTLTGRSHANLYSEYDPTEFPEELAPYLSDEPVVIDGKVRFSPELRLTPTMVKPLQGLQTYTKKQWGIFPHPKVCCETVPTHKSVPTKFNFTTGAITHPFYSTTKAGFRAHFDHMHGAVIVECTKQGAWVRQLIPANEVDGTFQDLDAVVSGGVVTHGHPVKGIVYGDVHIEQVDPVCAMATWGYDGTNERSLAHVLRPEYQVFHDLMDMTALNYHELNDFFKRYELWYTNRGLASKDFVDAADFLEHIITLAPNNVVVDSNHDYFVKKWLLGFDPARREDFENVTTYYELKLAVLEAIRKGEPYSLVELALAKIMDHRPTFESTLAHLQFLKKDEPFELLNVELSWHGHFGANGSRGSRAQYKFFTGKSVIGHSHSPGIESGCYQVGTSSKLDLGYNNGVSSWAHTHCILYENGARALVTMSDNKFWADQ